MAAPGFSGFESPHQSVIIVTENQPVVSQGVSGRGGADATVPGPRKEFDTRNGTIYLP